MSNVVLWANDGSSSRWLYTVLGNTRLRVSYTFASFGSLEVERRVDGDDRSWNWIRVAHQALGIASSRVTAHDSDALVW